MKLAKTWKILGPVGVLVGLLALAGAAAEAAEPVFESDAAAQPAPGGRCDDCTITYGFDDKDCVLRRRVSCATSHCVTIPGMSSQRCNRWHNSKTNQVTGQLMLGSASVQKCSGGQCNGATTTCDITYLKPVLKPPTVDTAATTETSTTEDESDPVTAEVVWDGAMLTYTVTNASSESVIVNWFGTPFTGVFVAPGDTLSELVPSPGQPVAALRDLILTDVDTGFDSVFDAVTYLVSEDEAPAEPDEF